MTSQQYELFSKTKYRSATSCKYCENPLICGDFQNHELETEEK